MPKCGVELDGLFKVLADPTRRAVLTQLAAGPASASVLAEKHAMALPSFMQHLKLMEQCGVLRSEKRGRVRTYRLEPKRLCEAEDWLKAQRDLWERRLDRLDAFVLDLHAKEKKRS